MMLLTACDHFLVPGSDKADWGGAKLWVGDSATGNVVREQTGDQISCNASEFDSYVCMHNSDYNELIMKLFERSKACQ